MRWNLVISRNKIPNTSKIIEKSQMHLSKHTKSVSKDYLFHESIYMTSQKRSNFKTISGLRPRVKGQS